jgi:aminoglycoside phosphotransferase (APT) family kinase protein
MTYITGFEPTADELNAFLVKLSFQDKGLNVWEHASGLTLGDVHTGNFIKAPDGRMVPIDVTVEGEVPSIPEFNQSA